MRLKELEQQIYKSYEARREPPRQHLGASVIGRPCDREIWYSYHHCPGTPFEGRMLRLFETGQREEARIVANLRAVGVSVWDTDETGKQWRFSSLGGHFSGSADGVAQGFADDPRWHLLEFKTHSQKSFEKLTNEGVKKAKPEHFIQMQCYMSWAELSVAMYIAINKNTDEIYCERIEADPQVAKDAEEKAAQIIFANEPPKRISDNADSFHCTYCQFSKICHTPEPGDFTATPCRTCCHASPDLQGTWSCSEIFSVLSVDTQNTGCERHLFLPCLIGETPALGATDDNLHYMRDNGDEMINHRGGRFEIIKR